MSWSVLAIQFHVYAHVVDVDADVGLSQYPFVSEFIVIACTIYPCSIVLPFPWSFAIIAFLFQYSLGFPLRSFAFSTLSYSLHLSTFDFASIYIIYFSALLQFLIFSACLSLPACVFRPHPFAASEMPAFTTFVFV